MPVGEIPSAGSATLPQSVAAVLCLRTVSSALSNLRSEMEMAEAQVRMQENVLRNVRAQGSACTEPRLCTPPIRPSSPPNRPLQRIRSVTYACDRYVRTAVVAVLSMVAGIVARSGLCVVASSPYGLVVLREAPQVPESCGELQARTPERARAPSMLSTHSQNSASPPGKRRRGTHLLDSWSAQRPATPTFDTTITRAPSGHSARTDPAADEEDSDDGIGGWYRASVEPHGFLPDGAVRGLADCAYVLVAHVEAAAVVLAMTHEDWGKAGPGWLAVALFVVSDVLQVISIGLWFRTAFIDSLGKLVGDEAIEAAEVVRHYRNGWFIFDALVFVPIDLIALGLGHPEVFWPLAAHRVLHLIRIPTLFRQSTPMKPKPLRPANALRCACSYFLCIHCIACVWMEMGTIPKGANVTEHEQLGWHFRYVEAQYFAITTITVVGFGDISPESRTQMVVGICLAIVGVTVNAVLQNSVQGLANIRDPVREEVDHKKNRLAAMMDYHGLPLVCRKEVFKIYPTVEENYLLNRWSPVLVNLPPFIYNAMQHSIHVRVLRQRRPFGGASHECLDRLVLRLKPKEIKAKTEVLRAGQPSADLHIVLSGVFMAQLDVASDDSDRSSQSESRRQRLQIHKGGVFGGRTLVRDGNQPEPCTVRACTPCEVLVLDKEVFEQLCDEYPDFRRRVATAVDRAPGGGDQQAASKLKTLLRSFTGHRRSWFGEKKTDSNPPSPVSLRS
eukprot:TRINITY_DN16399_c0_g1_i2.p1 TRINITY_DN16399_c0_g1~~TRINITY_DN16399_c0_g1_i2.p1  ORF type:complete len:752 (+),score=195.45 TRINITY_DN16399_c0_g1_i2:69-2258(+)